MILDQLSIIEMNEVERQVRHAEKGNRPNVILDVRTARQLFEMAEQFDPDLERRAEDLQSENDSLESRIGKEESDNYDLRKENESLEKQVEQLKAQLAKGGTK